MSATLAPHQVFVFAGAGVSCSAPSALPVFNSIRDQVLTQLGLEAYLPNGRGSTSELVKVAAGLAPEPFMLALTEAGIAVEDWLAGLLSGTGPNAAHQALAQLAASGARIWTVNFDTLIEAAAPDSVKCVAWPDDPAKDTGICKPHGTVGGKLIVTARQVLKPLASSWLDKLRSDIAGRTVVLLGYSARDLDLQPVWDDVLTTSAGVLWIDRWSHGQPVDEQRKRNLLPRTDRLGLLAFPTPVPVPAGVRAGAQRNPCWDFIAWCLAHRLITTGPSAIHQLFEAPDPVSFPPLRGRVKWARPAVQGLLGDYSAERASYLRLALSSGECLHAIRSTGISVINHGGNGVAAALTPARLLPSSGRLGQWRELADRKRITIWARTGRHDAVLRATAGLTDDAVSTGLILRSGSQRITGSLDLAEATAEAARRKALAEQHPVRIANAAFQRCLALLWAERLAEARTCLTIDLEPYAALAANRWVAWAGFIAGCLAVRTAASSGHDATDALRLLSSSQDRFSSERASDLGQ